MFGQNKIRKKEEMADFVQIHDVWYTIQGEGPLMGTPAVFVRFSGCTLACYWCDTEWNDAAPYTAVGDAVHRVLNALPREAHLVVLTGGEPLRHNLTHFLNRLFEEYGNQVRLGFRDPKPGLVVQVETAGTIYDGSLDAFDRSQLVVVVSPKTHNIHPKVAARAAAYKYVLQEGAVAEVDGLPTKSTQREGVTDFLARPHSYDVPVFVSPLDESGFSEAERTKNYRFVAEIAMKFGYRVSLQMHKHLDVP